LAAAGWGSGVAILGRCCVPQPWWRIKETAEAEAEETGSAEGGAGTITPNEADNVRASTAGVGGGRVRFAGGGEGELEGEEERRGPCAFLESVTIQTD